MSVLKFGFYSLLDWSMMIGERKNVRNPEKDVLCIRFHVNMCICLWVSTEEHNFWDPWDIRKKEFKKNKNSNCYLIEFYIIEISMSGNLSF